MQSARWPTTSVRARRAVPPLQEHHRQRRTPAPPDLSCPRLPAPKLPHTIQPSLLRKRWRARGVASFVATGALRGQGYKIPCKQNSPFFFFKWVAFKHCSRSSIGKKKKKKTDVDSLFFFFFFFLLSDLGSVLETGRQTNKQKKNSVIS